jgi:hypothetical protein
MKLVGHATKNAVAQEGYSGLKYILIKFNQN